MATFSTAALTNTAVAVFTGVGRLHSISVYNAATSSAFVQIFDAASGVSLGTTVATVYMWVPAEMAREKTFEVTQNDGRPKGRQFRRGLTIAATATVNRASAATVTVEDLEYS